MRCYFLILAVVLQIGSSFGCEKVRPHKPWNSSKNAAVIFADRNSNTIEIKPVGATFRIPIEWVRWFDETPNNIHLSRNDLNRIAIAEGEWDSEFSSICNSALPFDRCAAHIGSAGWGKDGRGHQDLQLRVFHLIPPTSNATKKEILSKATADLLRFTRKQPNIKCRTFNEWCVVSFSFERFYGDYGATGYVEFWIQEHKKDTFVFVFMHTDPKAHQPTISSIIESFHP